MTREAIVHLPSVYKQMGGTIEVKHEEESLCWLWAIPSLFPWDRPITWLYTPVVGNTRWPGDLWGVDTGGDLLIIESKQCRRHDDAFTDFVEFHRHGRLELSAVHWQQKWAAHLRDEIAFPDGLVERPKNSTGGILPRSNKRSPLRRWPDLATWIDEYIRSPQYSDAVVESLQARADSDDPTPFYFALMIESTSCQRLLTDAAISSGRKLLQLVGPGHVRVVAISCLHLPEDQARITARQVRFP